MTDGWPPLGVRDFAGVRFRYRIGSIDEQMLDEQYAAPRFFAAGYQPRETDVIVDAGAHIGPFTVLGDNAIVEEDAHAGASSQASAGHWRAHVAVDHTRMLCRFNSCPTQ